MWHADVQKWWAGRCGSFLFFKDSTLSSVCCLSFWHQANDWSASKKSRALKGNDHGYCPLLDLLHCYKWGLNEEADRSQEFYFSMTQRFHSIETVGSRFTLSFVLTSAPWQKDMWSVILPRSFMFSNVFRLKQRRYSHFHALIVRCKENALLCRILSADLASSDVPRHAAYFSMCLCVCSSV